MDIFLVKKDFDLREITLQQDEVVDAKFLSGEEIAKMIIENKVVRSVASRYEMYKEFLTKKPLKVKLIEELEV